MPTFDTGNAPWDQGLSTLANALFPDPSKAAQGYYYGSEARKAQLQSNTIIDQQNYKNRLMQGVYSRDGSYNTPPPASPTWQQPQNIPNAAPIMAPPANLPMGPAGGRLTQPTMTPGQAASTIGSILDNHPNSPTQGGTAPSFSSPAPNAGAPPAPTATGSDGSPGPDEASAPLHPNSVASGGGGVVYGGPAAANGSPAPVAVNLGTYVAEAVASGYDAAQAQAMGQATIGAAVQQGRITPQQAHELLATTGQAGPVNADIGARATIGSAQIQAASAATVARINQAGEITRTGMPLQKIIPDPNHPELVTYLPLSKLQGGPTTGMNPDAATETFKPVLVTPPGSPPGTPPVSATTGQAQTGPLNTRPSIAQPETQQGAVGTYVRSDNPLQERTMTSGQALTEPGWVIKPTDPNQVAALWDNAILRAPTPQAAQQLRERRMLIAPPPAAPKAEESSQVQEVINRQLNAQFPVPPGTHLQTNTLPAAASPELDLTFKNLEDQYFRNDPTVKNDHILAATKAFQQLVDEKYIDPNQSRGVPLFGQGHSLITKPEYDANGNLKPVAGRYFRIDIHDPRTGQRYLPGQAPTVQMRGPLSSVMTPTATAQPAATTAQPAGALPPGALAATPGSADGSTGTVKETGQRYVNRGGFAYPMQ